MRYASLASLAIAAVLVAPGCSRSKAQPRLAEAGPEVWIVDDVPYHIKSTHYERGPGNTVVYVIHYPAPKGTSAETLDKDGAGILVWPIVKYAYNNRTFERAKIPPASGSAPPSVNLAVDLLSPDGGSRLFRHEVPPGK
jgi:hypothetical protein